MMKIISGYKFLLIVAPLIAHFVTVPGPACGQATAETIQKILEEKGSSLIELRRDLHRHPELSGQEKRTAGIVAKRLKELGLEVRTAVGGHGIVGILRGQKPGPVVAYRADMDAVVAEEPDPVPFASETKGVRHICGHDMHTAIGVGIATALSGVRGEIRGTVLFLFQPSEENAEGAKAMLEDGALNDPRPDAIYALHCAPLEVGQIGSKEGMLLPGLDAIQVSLSGKGDLAAAAAECARMISAVSEMGTSDSFITAAVYESKNLAGENKWSLAGMVRASSEEKHAQARRRIEKALAEMHIPDIICNVEYTERAIPPVMNDSLLLKRAKQVLEKAIGKEGVLNIEEITPFFSEDFALFQQEVPGVMFFLGVSNSAKGILGMPHHPMFCADEEAIAIGAKAMSMVLLDHLANH